MNSDWAKAGCAQPEEAADFVGQSVEVSDGALGAPTSETRFKLGEGMNEFRIELQNLYPLPANADREILERTWTAGDCNLTVWFTDGRSVQALRWPSDASF